MRWDDIVKFLAAAIGGFVGVLKGYWTGAMTFLAILQVVDYVTGVICAALGRSTKTAGGALSSSVGFVGLAKKMFVWAVIIMACCVDRFVIGSGATVQTAVGMYYAANEAISVLENCAIMGLPVPAFLSKMLEVLRDKNDNKLPDEDEKQ